MSSINKTNILFRGEEKATCINVTLFGKDNFTLKLRTRIENYINIKHYKASSPYVFHHNHS